MSKQDGRVAIGPMIDKKIYKKFKRLCLDKNVPVRDLIESLMGRAVNKHENSTKDKS